tara:strand:- start:134 stop:628 length:495 start_codon:yes stop_codon:yes gene_type:complete
MSTKRYLRIPGKQLIITERMVLNAIEATRSNAEAARWLGVSYNTYKKYANKYGLFEANKNQAGVGIKRNHLNSKFKLDDILNNKHPDYPTVRLKNRLINAGFIEDECSLCGWNEERVTDNKICTQLDYVDGNKENKKFENLRLLCPNCYYTNVGDFQNAKKFCK